MRGEKASFQIYEIGKLLTNMAEILRNFIECDYVYA